MTWGATILSGRGKLAFRFHIEGCVYDFVTDEEMIKAAVTGSSAVAARKLGLKRDGLRFGDEADILNAKVKCKAPSIRIADIDGAASYAFAKTPDKSCWLTGGVVTSDTSITVTSNAGWTAGDVLHLNTEAMYVTGTTSTDTINVNRAVYGTQAQAHFTIGDQAGLQAPAVNNFPLCMQGRRCRLYAYGEGDDMQGSGTLCWIGLVLSDPESDNGGAEWSVSCGGLDRLLEKTFGARFGPFQPRGIYYPALNPFVLELREFDAASLGAATSSVACEVKMIGFWETQSEFLDAINDEIQTQTTAAGFTQNVSAQPFSDDGHWVVVVQTSPSPMLLNASVTSRVDVAAGHWVDTSTTRDVYFWHEFGANEEYTLHVYSGSVRSSAFFNSAGRGADLSQVDTWPENRIYLDGDIGSYWAADSVVLTPPGGVSSVAYSPRFTVDTSSKYIEFLSHAGTVSLAGGGGWGICYFGGPSPTDLTYTVEISGSPFDGATDVGAFMSALATSSNQYANLGTVPLLSSNEFDTSSVSAINEAIAGRAWAGRRSFSSLPNKKLSEILAEELKLIGCYITIGGTGKLRFKRASGPLAVVPSDSAALDTYDILVDETFPQWRKNSMGLINTVEYQGGYDPDEDRFTGDTVRVTDATSFGVTQTAATLKIRPYSVGPDPSIADIVDIGGTAFSLFSYPYASITAQVPLSKFSAILVGNTVTMESKHIFDPSTGTRLTAGQVSSPMLVTGRMWDIAKGRGTLTTYVPISSTAGYAPGVYIDSDAGAGTTWSFTLTADSPISGVSILPDATTVGDFFAVDDRVVVYQMDSDSPSYETATVTAVSGSQVDVEFDSPFGGIGADYYVITYAGAVDASLQAAQKAFGYIAGSDRLIDFSTPKPARTFGG